MKHTSSLLIAALSLAIASSAAAQSARPVEDTVARPEAASAETARADSSASAEAPLERTADLARPAPASAFQVRDIADLSQSRVRALETGEDAQVPQPPVVAQPVPDED